MTMRTVLELEGQMNYTRQTSFMGNMVWLSPQKSYYALCLPSTFLGSGTQINTQPVDSVTHPSWRNYFRGLGCVFSDDPATTAPFPNAPEQRSPMPRNNDGRTTCCHCAAPTRSIFLFMSTAQVCTRCGF